MKVMLAGLRFTDEDVVFDFITETDVRRDGTLIQQRSLIVRRDHVDAERLLDELEEKGTAVLKRFVADFETASALPPDRPVLDPDAADDGLGLGDPE